jgi:hypothetical protein
VAAAEPHAIRLVRHPRTAGQTAPILLVLLPGVNIRAEDFVAHDFVAMLQARADTVDLVIAEPEIDFYLDGSITRRLETMLGEEAPRYAQLWLGGISLGALGALLVGAGGRIAVDGLLLLAPFIGVPGLIAEIAHAGGFRAWQPGPIARNDGERQVCAWLKTYIETEARRRACNLGMETATASPRRPACWRKACRRPGAISRRAVMTGRPGKRFGPAFWMHDPS